MILTDVYGTYASYDKEYLIIVFAILGGTPQGHMISGIEA